jgi:hypothetical protein
LLFSQWYQCVSPLSSSLFSSSSAKPLPSFSQLRPHQIRLLRPPRRLGVLHRSPRRIERARSTGEADRGAGEEVGGRALQGGGHCGLFVQALYVFFPRVLSLCRRVRLDGARPTNLCSFSSFPRPSPPSSPLSLDRPRIRPPPSTRRRQPPLDGLLSITSRFPPFFPLLTPPLFRRSLDSFTYSCIASERKLIAVSALRRQG